MNKINIANLHDWERPYLNRTVKAFGRSKNINLGIYIR